MTVCFIHPPPEHHFLYQSFFSLLCSLLRRLHGRTRPRGVWSSDSYGPRGAVEAEENQQLSAASDAIIQPADTAAQRNLRDKVERER